LELVYLWVEDYKNIQKQGFNFSPRFECKFYDEYDEDGKLRDDCILEIKPKEHIENFFWDNINVTAIVGKNGSGKSSVLEMILPNPPHKKHSKYIIIGYSKNDKKYHSYGSIKNFDLKGIETISTLDIGMISSVVEICANNRGYNHNIEYINNLNLDFRTFEKYEYSDDDNNIFIPKYINQYKKKLNIFKNKTFFYTFDKVRFVLKEFNFNEIIQDINNFSNNLSENEKKELEESLQYSLSDDSFCDTLKRALIRFYILKSETYNYDNITKIFLIKNCFEIIKEDFSFIPIIDDIIEALEYLETNKFQEETNILNNKKYYFEFNIEDENLYKLWIFENFFDISDFIGTKKENLPIFNLELYDSKKDMTYNLLSNGEKQYIRLLIEIISNRSSGDISSNIEPKIYFFDEVETSLHPEWQKKIFNDIYNIFKIWKKNVHLIFLTHSPFLLSDIPKQNIIFLDKEKNGNCKVLKHDEVLLKKQTFGANIHTLLSDSFFMEDGLMGEFAKQKINEIIAFFDNKNELYKNDQDKLLKIINSIGEPFLKDKLLFMYNEKYPKTDEEKILELEKQIASIKNGQD
jgi:predicted ATPase